jgi:membrane protein
LISRQLRKCYEKANQFSGNRLDILKTTFATFTDTHASQAAASLSYYAIFSLFPLLLVLVPGGSYFLDRQEAYEIVTRLVQNALPVSTQVINENLNEVVEARDAVGIISLLALLWSASGFFTILAHTINLAWPGAAQRGFLAKRLMGLGMIAGLIMLFVLAVILEGMTNLIPFSAPDVASNPNQDLWRLFSSLGSWLTIFLMYLALYRWVPTVQVRWDASLWGALTASLAWKLVTSGFGWYLRSGFGRYQLVYGSLGAIVAWLFLIFIMSLITLFGAHLSAAMNQWKMGRQQVV